MKVRAPQGRGPRGRRSGPVDPYHAHPSRAWPPALSPAERHPAPLPKPRELGRYRSAREERALWALWLPERAVLTTSSSATPARTARTRGTLPRPSNRSDGRSRAATTARAAPRTPRRPTRLLVHHGILIAHQLHRPSQRARRSRALPEVAHRSPRRAKLSLDEGRLLRPRSLSNCGRRGVGGPQVASSASWCGATGNACGCLAGRSGVSVSRAITCRGHEAHEADQDQEQPGEDQRHDIRGDCNQQARHTSAPSPHRWRDVHRSTSC